MRTSITIPKGWIRLTDAILGRDGADVVVELDPLRVRPSDRNAFDRNAVVGSSDPSTVRVLRRAKARTRHGWPAELLEAVVVEKEQVVEARLVVVLDFMQRLGVMRARARPPELFVAHRAEVLEMMDSARPRWSDGAVIAVKQLWA
jgi:hypothetical protein